MMHDTKMYKSEKHIRTCIDESLELLTCYTASLCEGIRPVFCSVNHNRLGIRWWVTLELGVTGLRRRKGVIRRNVELRSASL